jgi:hypothetical protein
MAQAFDTIWNELQDYTFVSPIQTATKFERAHVSIDDILCDTRSRQAPSEQEIREDERNKVLGEILEEFGTPENIVIRGLKNEFEKLRTRGEQE